MGISVFPIPSASSKTKKKVTLTSGGTYTVPAGVTEINVLLVGGGGGACKSSRSDASGTGIGSDGYPGDSIWSTIATSGGSSIGYSIGAGGTAGNTNSGGAGGNTTMTGATTGTGGNGGRFDGNMTTGGPSFANNGGRTSVNEGNVTPTGGGVGGSGFIVVEYWSQEKI